MVQIPLENKLLAQINLPFFTKQCKVDNIANLCVLWENSNEFVMRMTGHVICKKVKCVSASEWMFSHGFYVYLNGLSLDRGKRKRETKGTSSATFWKRCPRRQLSPSRLTQFSYQFHDSTKYTGRFSTLLFDPGCSPRSFKNQSQNDISFYLVTDFEKHLNIKIAK